MSEEKYVYKVKNRETGEIAEFKLSLMTLSVSKRVIKWIISKIAELPDNIVNNLKDKELKAVGELLDSAIDALMSMDLLPEFLALVTCPVNEKENQKDVHKIADFYDNNLLFTQGVLIIHDFFTSISFAETTIIVGCIVKSVKATLNKIKEARESEQHGA